MCYLLPIICLQMYTLNHFTFVNNPCYQNVFIEITHVLLSLKFRYGFN